MSHPNSRHTALGRWQFVRMVVQEGSTFVDAAARSHVARSTVWEWVRRWRAASDADRASRCAWRIVRVALDAAQRGCQTMRSGGSVSCANAQAGVRDCSPRRRAVPIRRFTGCCSGRVSFPG